MKVARNILITSVAAKIPLVNAFREAARSYGCKVVGGDANSDVAAAKHLDGFSQLPVSSDPDFIPAIFSLCRQHDIGLIVPTRDGDLPPLASAAGELEEAGVLLPLPNEKTVALCQDKKAFSDFLTENGIRAIPILDDIEELKPPYFSRARSGAGGRAGGLVVDPVKAGELLADDNFLLHPFIDWPEFSIDVLSDFRGDPCQAVVRERRYIEGGESKLTTTVEAPELEHQAITLAARLALKGHNIFQAFAAPGESPIFIEVNLRFGGASILSVHAGLDSPDRLIRLAFGTADQQFAARRWNPIMFGMTLKRDEAGDTFYRADIYRRDAERF